MRLCWLFFKTRDRSTGRQFPGLGKHANNRTHVQLWSYPKSVMPKPRQAYFRHALYYLMRTRQAQEFYKTGVETARRGLNLFDSEWGNINVAHTWAASQAEKDDEAAKLCGAYTEVGVYLLALRLHPHEQIVCSPG